MPKLDSPIEKLFRQADTELVLRAGELPVLQTPTGPVPVLKQALSPAQIVGLLTELAPVTLQAQLASDGTHAFGYASPSGKVRVQVEKHGEQLSASLRPEPGQSLPSRAQGPLYPTPVPVSFTSPGTPAPSVTETLSTPLARVRTERIPFHSVESPVVKRVPTPPPVEPPAPTPAPFIAPHMEQRRLPPADPRGAMEFLLKEMVERRASDLHLSSDTPPMFRINGDICSDPSARPLSPQRLKEMLWSMAPERNREEWERAKDTDFAHENSDARFRVNVFADRKGIGAVLRQIPNKIKSAEELGLSQPLLDLCHLTKGLVLVTGPTGSGKSTTLASMIDYVNTHRSDHIITIEDPIEFVHPNKRCLVNQREIGVHTQGFKAALRAALRDRKSVV